MLLLGIPIYAINEKARDKAELAKRQALLDEQDAAMRDSGAGSEDSEPKE